MKPLLVVFSFLLGCSASAQLATDEYYFRKLSWVFKQQIPSPAENGEFKEAKANNNLEAFIKNKIQTYSSQNAFHKKMKILIDENFRLQTGLDFLRSTPEVYKGAYDYLIEDILKNNLPWDNLLLAKNYSYDFTIDRMYDSDRIFYQNILNASYKRDDDLIQDISFSDVSKPNITESVGFDPKDPRVAGVLTTRRFLMRYQNTALNKNRRRAAAIFRNFLCDDIVAAIPAKTNDSEKDDFDILLPETRPQSKTEQQLRTELKKNDPHGSLPGCMACHSKLDPMGKVFGLSAAGLSHKASPGALVYKRNGREINIPVTGVAELAEKIAQQPEYIDCQVNLFWKWFIGQDVPKSAARHQQLVEQFEKGDRRPIDFITFLVQTPEFRTRPILLTENQILARKAGKILKRCYDCHKDQDLNPQMKTWDLSDLPYGEDTAHRLALIRQLVHAVDLENNGERSRMPPKESVWKLSPQEFETLKLWIAEGAPDYSGRRQVE